MLNKTKLIHACQSVIRQLLILSDKGYFLDRADFNNGCSEKKFIPLLKERFSDEKLSFLYVDKSLGTFNPEIYEYFENAMARHINTVSMEDFGLRSNALFMGVNIVLFIIDEANALNT